MAGKTLREQLEAVTIKILHKFKQYLLKCSCRKKKQ